MADPDRTDPTLAEVLSALGEELTRGETAGVHVEAATLDLDVAVEAGADGGVAFRVGRAGGGGKRGRGTRLTLTVRPGARPAAVPAPAEAPEPAPVAEAPTPGGGGPTAAREPADVSPPGFLDLLADALRSLSDPGPRTPGSPWPVRPLPRDDRGEGTGPRRGA